MTHRLKNLSTTANLDPVTCEKYKARHLKKDTAKTSTSSNIHKNRNMSKQLSYNASLLNRNNAPVQENLPLKHRKSCGNLSEYLDDASSLQPSIPTRQRSRSVAEREPWGQILKSERSTTDRSVFGSFDPLRTLHFLVKELQFQLKAVLPADTTVLQIVCDMYDALKRIPPEVASTVHLQQALDRLSSKCSKSSFDIPEKLRSTSDKAIQTSLQFYEDEKLHKIMMENTLKLEESCKQMETLCLNLKTEKEDLEKQLKFEKENVIFYKNRILDLENASNLLTPKVRSLEKEKEELKLELERLKIRYETQQLKTSNNLKAEIADLKNSKASLEQESSKLKHQLKLSYLEKEKYSAILAVRQQQINEMKSEILQLHEVVSFSLLDLQKNSIKSLPISKLNSKECKDEIENKENIDDCSISTIHSDTNQQVERPFKQKDESFKELPTGDIDVSDTFSLHLPADLHLRKKEKKFT